MEIKLKEFLHLEEIEFIEQKYEMEWYEVMKSLEVLK